jgi:diacylglycerol kinase
MTPDSPEHLPTNKQAIPPSLTANWHVNPEDYSPQVSPNRWASFQYALAGWGYMLRYQKNIRIQAVATIAVVLLGLWLGINPLEWAVLVLTISLEWMAEFINAAIEAAINVASPEYHPMARVGKDVAAAAVLLGAVASVLVGLLILGPPLLARFGMVGS